MEKKFAVGQVWQDGRGFLYRIAYTDMSARYPVGALSVLNGVSESYTSDGFYFKSGKPTELDLVQLVTNADGSPATQPANVVNIAPIEGKVFDQTRTAFIERLTHEMFVCHHDKVDSISRAVCEAVKLRDELVRGEE